MAHQLARTLVGFSCSLFSLLAMVKATPNPAFPFNSQVPLVARVNQQYNFQFSDSTFAPDSQNHVYSLSGQPSWLTIDSATRTLRGTPGSSDAGAQSFMLTAVDNTGAAHMQCTLVISADPAPRLTGDISKQLAQTANLSSSEPPVVTLLPSTEFTFDFEPESFIDVVSRRLFYYATLADHTPLPSWLNFNAEQLTFSGTAPDLSAFPQSWQIALIASDVAGFAGAYASFTIAIATQQLVFVPEEQQVNATAGKPVNITILQTGLFRNNVQLNPDELKNAAAELPDWLHFDPSTLHIVGDAPRNLSSENITVTVTDQLGNSAAAIINIVPGNSSLFNGQVGTLVARAGEQFSYQFDDSLFDGSDLDLNVTIPATASWLSYDAGARELRGAVPLSATATTVQATMVARAPGSQETQKQTFTIDIKAKLNAVPTTTSRAAAPSATATFPMAAAHAPSKPSLSSGSIAAIVISCLVAVALLLIALVWCCRRRRRTESYLSPAPSKESISRPIIPSNGDTVTADVEKTAGVGGTRSDPSNPPPPIAYDSPPRIHLELPLASRAEASDSTAANKRRSKWNKRFSRVSHASSLGIGEEAIRADENIPEWGQNVTALHTPHDSFSIPAELARISRNLSDTSPSKKAGALKRLRHSRHGSHSSFKRLSLGLGLGIGSSGGGFARHSSRNARDKHRKRKSSADALSPTQEVSSVITCSTPRTSMFSIKSGTTTRASDFPPPPVSRDSAIEPSKSRPELKRKSIRMVDRSNSTLAVMREDTVEGLPDERPFDEKRLSFCKKSRASASWASPSFFSASNSHRSRVPSESTRQALHSSAKNSIAGSVRISRASRTLLTMYSESSSLGPPGHPDSPHRHSQRCSQKVINPFAPNYPRAITKSTLHSRGPSHVGHNSSESWTTSSRGSKEPDWIHDVDKPRHERSWVMPGEASPTPPPVPATMSRPREPSARSPLSPASSTRRRNPAGAAAPKNRMSAPIGLVSADSMHRGRPKMGNVRRPVSVEEVARLSSLRAEPDVATVAGSERSLGWMTEGESEDEGFRAAGLMGRAGDVVGKGNGGDTGRSDLSGVAFL